MPYKQEAGNCRNSETEYWNEEVALCCKKCPPGRLITFYKYKRHLDFPGQNLYHNIFIHFGYTIYLYQQKQNKSRQQISVQTFVFFK